MMSRRSEPRFNGNDSVKYRMAHTNIYKTGILKNSSTQGALLWVTDDFAVGNYLEVLAWSHDTLEHVHLRVVRSEGANNEGYKGYGCRVEMRISETHQSA